MACSSVFIAPRAIIGGHLLYGEKHLLAFAGSFRSCISAVAGPGLIVIWIPPKPCFAAEEELIHFEQAPHGVLHR